MSIYEIILNKIKQGRKLIALLIDPDKCGEEFVAQIKHNTEGSEPDIILVGGSIVSTPISETICIIKRYFDQTPLILFPGNISQLSPEADAVLFLSLISGRNPEYIIGQQVMSAPTIKRMSLETIPTGYMLINGGCSTAVQYVSSTTPIPADKSDIAVATAMAGEMLGLKALYLEAGSGAINHVPAEMVKAVRKSVKIPIIVGGGIRTRESALELCKAGADIIVVGTALEEEPDKAKDFIRTIHSCK
ncbi:MAG: geranylgeranylglyceryl/heptaprenylglyceryl phosphate synthase [Marinilabiliaceae bacterium]|nr:geranylgeranylglyceryl/heptaprenylglyceryl phosphate synthase [Marinilabiliaceae bacterium]